MALVLLAVIAFRPQSNTSTAQTAATSRPGGTVSSPAPASPSDSTATPSAAAPPTPSAAGWTAKYQDTSITLPAAGECFSGAVNFDHGRGHTDADTFTDDLFVQSACPIAGVQDSTLNSMRQWGTSQTQEPGPTQCQNDANRNTQPNTMSASALKVNSAYCLITAKHAVVWFKITAKTGSDHQGFTMLATLWIPSDGN